MFEFTYILSKEDCDHASSDHMLHSQYGRRLRRFSCALCILILLGLAAFFYRRNDMHAAIVCAAMLLPLLIFHHRFFAWVVKMVNKQLERDEKTFLEGTRAYRFGDDTFSVLTNKDTTESNYAILQRVDVGEYGVHLYMTVQSFHLIPNRAFADENEKERFIAFIRRKIEDRKT